ncbi:hypothetical protein RSSE_c3359 [Ralstonia solanacearum]|nr:hypothetical protein RSSE_c3359 [Ralstonia solanacearum]
MMADYSDIIQAAAKRYNVDPALIRGVIATESGGDPKIKSNVGATGLMQIMPSNYKALGISDATDPQQNIFGGTKLLSQLLDTSPDVVTALRRYHGGDDQSKWGPVNSAYPGKVLGAAGVGSQQMPQKSVTLPGIPVSQSVNRQSDDAIFSAFSGGGAPVANAQGPQSDDAIFAAFTKGQQQAQPTQGGKPPAPPSVPPQTQNSSNPVTQFGQGLAGLADTIASGPGALVAQGEYAVRRALGQSPEQAQQGSEHGIGAFFQNPVAKAVNGIGQLFGDNTDIRNTVGYQNEASQGLMRLVGQGIEKGSNVVANVTGLPAQDISNMAQTGLMAAVPAAKAGIAKLAPIVRDAALATAADDMNVKVTPSEARPIGPPMQERAMVGGGAASSNMNPYPVLTGEEASRGAFPQIKTSKIAQDVTPQEQAIRAGIVNEIMGDNAGRVRTGVISGNENLLRDENAAAKSPQETPANLAMRQQIAQEQQALSNYAEKRIEATGASPNLINNEQRGNVINDAVNGEGGLIEYLQQAKQQIYDRARAESGDNPIKTSHVDALLKDPQFLAEAERAGNSRVVSGVTQLINLARSTGFKDPLTGEITAPGSVAAWDAVRKSNNADWNEGNARTIAAINQAIDRDVASAAGSESYKLGDALHQVEQSITGARGFKQIFGNSDSNGVKSGASVEQIPDRLNNMPIDQWSHIYNTLNDLSNGRISGAPEGIPAIPPELQKAAAAARNEISGALAREVYQQGASKAGVWNQNSVNKTLNSVVGHKILQTFPPDEIAAFHTLNYGGQIMPGVHAYEGAAQQAARLNKPGFVEKYAPSAGASIGGAIGHALPVPGAGVLGTLGGAKAGAGLSRLMEGRRGNQQFEALQEELRNNSKKGLDRLR